MLRLELTAEGTLVFDGASLAPEQAPRVLRPLAPRSILLLPHRRLSVEGLFRWYDLLATELGVPVAVGVLPPSTSPAAAPLTAPEAAPLTK